MKHVIAVAAGATLCLALAADINLAERSQPTSPQQTQPRPAATMTAALPAASMSLESQKAFVGKYCSGCHNDDTRSGGLDLTALDLSRVDRQAETAEKVIRKLRAGMMPPPEAPRPDKATISGFTSALETAIDKAAALRPNPGVRALQRLNRAEYANSVRELLSIDVDVTALLPPDSMGRGFDNIADVLTFSPALMEGYIRAASKISRVAVGDVNASPAVSTYNMPRTSSQMRHTEGAPFGTRGGVAVMHNFPADGEYIFRMDLFDDSNGLLVGQKIEGEQIELSLNGERLALLDINPRMSVSLGGVFVQTPPIRVKAGPQRVAAAFIERAQGPIDDLMQPIEQTLADTEQSTDDGITILPHLKALAIRGPFNVTGTSDTPSRRRIFTCRPTVAAEEATCATEIIGNLASRAYRRPANAEDLEGLMNFYRIGREEGDFEAGIRTALEAVLTSPYFVFRFEREPAGAKPGQNYPISDLELASRLSYFLWSTPPDDQLLNLASQNKLRAPGALAAQVKRMLASPRSEALAMRFAVQWLKLHDLEATHPDPLLYPQFDTTLAESMRRETELFFDSIVREDRDVLDLLNADFTFVDERLAKHYRIPNVVGNRFRRIPVKDDFRRGLLGHGSILTLTSIADRTSPVMRGKFVMEVLLGTPPPPPPPDVPDLNETKSAAGDRLLTVRERLAEHRANPTCAGCHNIMDPIGLAMENFDVTGRWREMDSFSPIDPTGQLFDGTRLNGPVSLRNALLNHSESFFRNFAENLMMYGLGRRVEYYDMPTIRTLTRRAEQNNNRFSSFVLGIVESPQFQMRTVQQETTVQHQN